MLPLVSSILLHARVNPNTNQVIMECGAPRDTWYPQNGHQAREDCGESREGATEAGEKSEEARTEEGEQSREQGGGSQQQ